MLSAPLSFRNYDRGAYTDNSDPYGGHDGALHNVRTNTTIAFMDVAIFKDKICEMVRTFNSTSC